MSQVERGTLERPTSVRRAHAILDAFFNDRLTYSDADFYSRSSACKALAEEYCPLVRLAQDFRGVRSVRLLSHANAGPDGAIYYWWRPSSFVQITCAHEDYDRALMREQMLAGKIVLSHQDRYRDKATGLVVSTGSAGFEPAADVRARVERILKAIKAKERKHYPGTDTLVVQESPAGFTYLQEGRLHERVCEAVLENGRSCYDRIYVNYGDDLRRIE